MSGQGDLGSESLQGRENGDCCSRQRPAVLPTELGKPRAHPLRGNVRLLWCFLPFQFFHQAF